MFIYKDYLTTNQSWGYNSRTEDINPDLQYGKFNGEKFFWNDEQSSSGQPIFKPHHLPNKTFLRYPKQRRDQTSCTWFDFWKGSQFVERRGDMRIGVLSNNPFICWEMSAIISIPSEWLYRSPSLILICLMVSGKDLRETLLSSLVIKSKETLLETLYTYIYLYMDIQRHCIYIYIHIYIYIYACVCVCLL